MDLDNYGQQLTYSGARAILQRTVQRSKIKKRVNLKLFRHSEATRLSKHLPESTMRMRHGWTKGSAMPSRYVHLVNADVDEKILEMYGIKTLEETEKPKLPKKCPICYVHNSPDSEFCYRCRRPLDLETALKQEENSQEQNLNANKTLLKLFIQMVQSGQIPKIDKDELKSLITVLNA